MSQKPLSLYGSISYTKLKKALLSGEVKAQKIQTQAGEEIVVDINVWVHDQADQYNNNAAVQCQLKNFQSGDKNPYYIGNLKFQTPKATEASATDINNAVGSDEDDDLPF